MYIYMGHMRYADTRPYADDFWDRNWIERIRGWVDTIDTAARTLVFTTGDQHDRLVLATGSIANRWAGQETSTVSRG